MERARLHIFREIDVLEEWLGLGRPALRRTLPWIALTLVLGLMFLGGQALAWKQLTAQDFASIAGPRRQVTSSTSSPGFTPRTSLSAFWLCSLPLRSHALQTRGVRQIAVDSTAWFWHTMGFAWLVLFGLLVLGQ